ncbi:UDP-4-amino-4,6-dideoxy-N-acetyl-beta-L-altrosamine transaminase [bacterium]|nr:UDP-4-amino-4,6-dideoxy-N-acetyl-beta-L-altrosamine transaminase [bacterium]
MIPYGRQNILDDDIDAIVKVLKSDYLTQGPVVPEFEKSICEYTGASFAIAVNSGTSALHIACLSLGLGKGDWLWTSTISFVASANCGLYCGSKVDFVDIDPTTWNISVDQLKTKLIVAKNNNKLPKILVLVHLSGFPCDMEEIYQLSKEFGFYIVEDACHAIGGRYRDNQIGSCMFSDITVFSFHPVKTMTTGEGGMAVTNDCDLAKKMTILRSHGITRDQDLMTHESDGAWYYQQINLGFNYRMTDIQAALGISQLSRLNSNIKKRHEIINFYNENLSGLQLQLPCQSKEKYTGAHLYIIRIKKKAHHEVFQSLIDAGIGVNLHYIPIHTQPYYQNLGFAFGDFPEAESYYKEAISLPIFPDLSQKDQGVVVSAVIKAMQ